MVPAEVLLVRNMIAPFIENSAIMHKVVSIDLTVINLHHVYPLASKDVHIFLLP